MIGSAAVAETASTTKASNAKNAVEAHADNPACSETERLTLRFSDPARTQFAIPAAYVAYYSAFNGLTVRPDGTPAFESNTPPTGTFYEISPEFYPSHNNAAQRQNYIWSIGLAL